MIVWTRARLLAVLKQRLLCTVTTIDWFYCNLSIPSAGPSSHKSTVVTAAVLLSVKLKRLLFLIVGSLSSLEAAP